MVRKERALQGPSESLWKWVPNQVSHWPYRQERGDCSDFCVPVWAVFSLPRVSASPTQPVLHRSLLVKRRFNRSPFLVHISLDLLTISPAVFSWRIACPQASMLFQLDYLQKMARAMPGILNCFSTLPLLSRYFAIQSQQLKKKKKLEEV